MFLCAIFGHKGPNSKDFCLYCKAQLENKDDDPQRMICAWGDGDTAHTLESLFKITNEDPVLPVPIENLVVLPLHIKLGLTKDFGLMLLKQVF